MNRIMERKKIAGMALAVAVLAVAAALCFRQREWQFSEPAMGTRASITLVGTPWDKVTGRLRRLSSAAFAEIRGVEKLMSVYREDSDVARLNREASSGDVLVDQRTFEILSDAISFFRLTGGAFDVAILPLERRWGFKTDGRRGTPPAEIKGRRSGSDGIVLKQDGGRNTVRFLREGMGIDLGGIAAGYAADRAVERLQGMGVKDALVDIGGDCYCLGASAGGTPWRVAVRHPRRDGILTILDLSDAAVTTSGDYEDFFVEDGKRYSHIFDPGTERPAERGVVSATVIAPSCTAADAIATALIVLGEEKGIELVGKLSGTECILVIEDSGGLRLRQSLKGSRASDPQL